MDLQPTPALDFTKAAVRAGRNAGPALLVEWLGDGRLPVEHLGRVITDVWQMAEWPTRSLGIDFWVELFEMAGFVADDGQPFPVEPLTAYRGATREHYRGMSWSMDVDQAQWFAQRARIAGLDAVVFRISIPPAAVLALVGMEGGRDEREVVVNPRHLPPIERAEII